MSAAPVAGSSGRRRAAGQVNGETPASRAAFWLLLALLVWVPLPLGSNRPLAWIVLEVAAMMAAAAVLTAVALGHRPITPALRAARWPLILLGAWLGYLVIQIVPLGQQAVAILSPAANALREYASLETGGSIPALSVDPAASFAELRKALAYVSVFLLVLLVVDSRERLRTVAIAMVGVAAVVALYGLTMTLSGIEMIWWYPKTAYRGFVTGTFVNRNHFATFMGLGLSLGLGLLLSSYSLRLTGNSVSSAARGLVDTVLSRRGLLVPALLAMLAALVLTASRGGTVAFWVAILVGTLVAGILRGWSAREVRLLPVVLGIAVAAVVWLGPGELPERFGDFQDQRIVVWQGTLDLIGDYPLTGAGNGTFEHIFPLYGGRGLYQYYDHAHNDYLEVAAEQGAVGLVLIALATLMISVKLLGALRQRRDPLCRGLAFAATVGMLTMLLHAVVDFPFEIPALSTWYFALLGLGLVAGILPTHRTGQRG